MVTITTQALESAKRLNTPRGQASLLIARILDSGVQDTGSSIAALIKQYDATLEKALEGAQAEKTLVEQLREEHARSGAA